MTDRTELAVRKTIEVAAPIETAFRAFTEEIASWWPIKTHSVMEESARTVVIESGIGGRLFERGNDGSEHLWGTLTDWDPPTLVAFTWHPGHPGERITRVTVRFSEAGSGTSVELVHTGWEVLGDKADETRASYDNGWVGVLAQFVEAANKRSA